MIYRTLLCSAAALSMATVAAAQDEDLLVFDYPGFENPEFHAGYIETHGASPSFAFFGDEEEAFQKLVSGFEADVTHICGGSVTKWVESGIIEPWDTSRITAFADLNSDLTGQDVASGEKAAYFIPTDYGSTAIAYNPEVVPAEDVASLSVFTNPAYAGRMTIPDNVDDAFALAYLATGVTNWSEATEAEFEAAAAWLREVQPNLRTFWTDPAELAQLLSTGEVVIAWAWNETFPTMVEEGRPIAFEREPAEGSSLWLCGYVNMVDGPGSEDKAYDFLNAMLDPSSAVPLMQSGYGTANQAALVGTFTTEDLVAAGLQPIDAPILAQLPMSQERREKQAEAFELIKAGF